MSDRDDMVFGVSLGPQLQASAPVRAREERREAGARRGPLRRLIEARAKRQAVLAGVRAASRRVAVGAARYGASGLARAGSRLVASPVGAVVAALAVAGLVTLRLATGRPIEGMAEDLNKMFLGDIDDAARANMATREQFKGDAEIARIVGQEGKANRQVMKLAEDIRKLNMQREVGASLLRSELPSNNLLDMLILRAAQAFTDAWQGTGGPAAVERFRTVYGETINKAGGKGGAR